MSTLSGDRAATDRAVLEVPSTRIQSMLEAAAVSVSRYGLVVVLLLIGVLKFTPG